MTWKKERHYTNATRIKRCAVCGSQHGLQCHHIFYGYSRKAADKYGLTCWLCWEHHQGDTGVHHNIELDLDLKRRAQKVFEDKYGHGKFMEVFHKNYL